MIRFFSLIAVSFVLLFAVGTFAGDPGQELPGLKPKKLDDGEKKPDANPKLKKFDDVEGKKADDDKKNPGKGADDKKGKKGVDPKDDGEPLKKLQPGGDDKGKPGQNKPTTPPEDPRQVIARIVKNMEASEGHLKNKKAGKETHDIQKKILEDLDKLLKQADPPEDKKGGGGGDDQNPKQAQKPKPDQGKKDNQKPDNGKPEPKPSNKDNGKKPGPEKDPKQDPNGKGGKEPQPKPGQITQGKDGAKIPGELIKGGNPPTPPGQKIKKEDGAWGHLSKQQMEKVNQFPIEEALPQYQRRMVRYYLSISKE